MSLSKSQCWYSNNCLHFWKCAVLLNEGESAASFCWQLAALFQDMFCNFYLSKYCKIVKTSTTTKAREKMSTDLESLEFCNFLDVRFTILKTIKFYLIKFAADFYWQPRYLLDERASFAKHLLLLWKAQFPGMVRPTK